MVAELISHATGDAEVPEEDAHGAAQEHRASLLPALHLVIRETCRVLVYDVPRPGHHGDGESLGAGPRRAVLPEGQRRL
jgi:hypothetical protein